MNDINTPAEGFGMRMVDFLHPTDRLGEAERSLIQSRLEEYNQDPAKARAERKLLVQKLINKIKTI